jgi:hypothetical protein
VLRTTRLLRFVALGVAGIQASCLGAVLLRGPIDFRMAGLRVRSDPSRSLLWVVGMLAVFAWAGGAESLAAVVRAVTRRVPPAVAAVTLAALTGVGGLALATTAATGADSYGYVSQAELWLHANLRQPQPWVGEVPWPNAAWTFTPLGYVPEQTAPWRLTPVYPAGLPVLFAIAKRVGGQSVMFAVVPVFGVILVAVTYGIGRRLAGPPAGVCAAWLIATSPIVLSSLTQPMSDIPAAAASSATVYCLLGGTPGALLMAGVWSGIAIAVRPNLALLVPLGGVWFLMRPGASAPSDRRLRDLAAWAAGLGPGVLVVGLILRHLFGSPVAFGYGPIRDLFAWSHVWPNLVQYGRLAFQSQATFVLIGTVGLVAGARWAAVGSRRSVWFATLMVLSLTAEYLAYFVMGDDWHFLRYLLPVWPLLAVGAGGLLSMLAMDRRRGVALAAIGLVVVMGLDGLLTAREGSVFDDWRDDRRGPAVAAVVDEATPPRSVVLAMLHSGSLRYYANRVTLRFDLLDPRWLDRAVDWMSARDVHVYAALESGEVEDFRRRFAGERLVAALDRPIVVYEPLPNGRTVSVYDLSAPAIDGPPQQIRTVDFAALRSVPPSPPPTLTFGEPRR